MLDLIDTRTDQTRVLADSVVSFSWSPDSKALAVQGPNAVIGTVSLSGKERLFPIKGLRSRIDPPEWSPDARWIVFSAISTTNELDSRIYLIRPSGRNFRRLA